MSEPRTHLIESKEIKEYLALTSDDDYFTEIDVRFVDKVIELERLARIGKALEKAISRELVMVGDFGIFTIRNNTKQQICVSGVVEELLEWAESEVE